MFLVETMSVKLAAHDDHAIFVFLKFKMFYYEAIITTNEQLPLHTCNHASYYENILSSFLLIVPYRCMNCFVLNFY